MEAICNDPSVFRVELFDGTTGLRVNSVEGIVFYPGKWIHFETILTKYAPGTTQSYARVSRADRFGSFIAYAVVNHGGQAGERTGDGAFISSHPNRATMRNLGNIGGKYWGQTTNWAASQRKTRELKR